MLSKRDFFSIFLMMLTLFFIFQFSQVVKELGNEYDVNGHVTEVALEASDVPVTDSSRCVWYIGDINSGVGDAVSQWCTYTRQELKVFSEIPEPVTDSNIEAIVFDTETCDIRNKTDKLKRLAGMKSVMIFGNLPDAAYIDSDEDLKALLGITKVVDTDIHVEGVQIFSGFLFGGEAVYLAHDEDEKKFEDLDLDIAWFDTGLGTKTYIVGIMDEDVVHPYDFPKMIWRSYNNGTFIYAVNGDYLQGMMGIGFLDAMMWDTKDYYIYPIVNANNVVISDFPSLSDENKEKLMSIYSRNVEAFQRDIAWPGLVTMSSLRDFKMTCFISDRYDYSDSGVESNNEIRSYLQMLNELGAEAGRSMDYKGDISLAQKSESSRIFFANEGIDYQFRSLYIKKWDDALKTVLEEQEPQIRTVVGGDRKNDQAISFCSENVTLQYVTNKAEEYTYKNALLYRSLLTSLGYTNVLIDMNKALWPETKDDEWQNFFDKVFSYYTTYWSDRLGFATTTISESDARIRKMLSVSYDSEMNGKEIVLNSSGADENYFVLRTHEMEIASVTDNVEYTLIEQDVYLLKVRPGKSIIKLKDAENVYQYEGPLK